MLVGGVPGALEIGERGPRSTAQPEAEPALPVLNEQALLDMSNGYAGCRFFPA